MPIRKDLEDLTQYIENSVTDFSEYIDVLQDDAYSIVRDALLSFELNNGRIVAPKDLSKRLLSAQRELESVFGTKKYKIRTLEFLTDLGDIQDKTIDLHKNYNDLKGELNSLSEAKKIIYSQAQNAFSSGAIAESYIEPVKNLLARQALGRVSQKKALNLLQEWNKGETASGRLNVGNKAPNLQKYGTVIARDTAFSMQRTTNDIVAKEIGLTSFIYVGGLVKDSRDLCKHLVNLRRKITLDEMPKLITMYPEGLYPNTTKENFMQVCGGYGCMHTALGVRSDKKEEN